MLEAREIMDCIHSEIDCRDVVSNMLGIHVEEHKYAGQTAILCMNHEDTNLGSCFVKKEFAHCFACGWHADAVSIVMKARNCTWFEAVKELNDFYGLDLDLSSEDKKPKETLRMSAAELQLIGITDKNILKELYDKDREQFWSYLAACCVYTDQSYSIAESSKYEQVNSLMDEHQKVFVGFVQKLKKLKKGDKPNRVLVIYS